MPSCEDMLVSCTWQGQDTQCLRLFSVTATDDGFCCVFNAISSKDLLNQNNS
jgi:hypothetical protein